MEQKFQAKMISNTDFQEQKSNGKSMQKLEMHLTVNQTVQKALNEHEFLIGLADEVLPKMREALYEILQNIKRIKYRCDQTIKREASVVECGQSEELESFMNAKEKE